MYIFARLLLLLLGTFRPSGISKSVVLCIHYMYAQARCVERRLMARLLLYPLRTSSAEKFIIQENVYHARYIYFNDGYFFFFFHCSMLYILFLLYPRMFVIYTRKLYIGNEFSLIYKFAICEYIYTKKLHIS